MNGPIKMFRSRQIVRHDLPVELPTCMYKIKNIHTPRNGTVIKGNDHVPSAEKNLSISEKVKQFLKNNQEMPEMAALQDRQEQILKQLAELKQQMCTLRGELKSTPEIKTEKCSVVTTKATPSVDVSKLPEIIINASPLHPPYSLEIVQKLLANVVHLSITTHLHSSVPTLTKCAVAMASNLEKFKPKTDVPKINIRLIWKEVGAQMEMIITSTPIIGEVNILRFLARTVPVLNYEALNPFEIDEILDVSYTLARSKTKTEKMSLLQAINKKLAKSNWLCGRPEITIADIAAYSAIKQTAENDANINVTKWLQRCEKV